MDPPPTQPPSSFSVPTSTTPSSSAVPDSNLRAYVEYLHSQHEVLDKHIETLQHGQASLHAQIASLQTTVAALNPQRSICPSFPASDFSDSYTRKRKKKIRRISDDAEMGKETRRKIATGKECQECKSEDVSAEVWADASTGYTVNVVREKGEQLVRIPPSNSAKLKAHQVTKEGLSARVVDRHHGQRKISEEEMLHLFEFGDDESHDGFEQDSGANDLEKLPKHELHHSHGACSSDKLMEDLVGKHCPSSIANFHLHETLSLKKAFENKDSSVTKKNKDSSAVSVKMGTTYIQEGYLNLPSKIADLVTPKKKCNSSGSKWGREN